MQIQAQTKGGSAILINNYSLFSFKQFTLL